MRWKMGAEAVLNSQSGFAGEVERLGVMDLTGNQEEKGIGAD
jgi:hypothetical protein